MPIPPETRAWLFEPSFWSDLLGEQIYNEDRRLKVRLSITDEHSLIFRGDSYGGFSLDFVSNRTGKEHGIAYNALDGHPFPHGLRWTEVQLFGRCMEMRDPDWLYPGPPVLLLSLAAPVTSDEDAALAFPILHEAWNSLGLFNARRTHRLVRDGDVRNGDDCGTRMEWRFGSPDGWALHNAYSLRGPGSKFPFAEWAGFVQAAEAGFRSAGGDPESLSRPSAPGPVPGPEPAHRLEVQFPSDVDPRMVDEFKRAVFECGLGRTEWTGGVCFPAASDTQPTDAYDTTIFGDLNEGLAAIRSVFAKYGLPAGTGIWSWTHRRQLPVVP